MVVQGVDAQVKGTVNVDTGDPVRIGDRDVDACLNIDVAVEGPREHRGGRDRLERDQPIPRQAYAEAIHLRRR